MSGVLLAGCSVAFVVAFVYLVSLLRGANVISSLLLRRTSHHILKCIGCVVTFGPLAKIYSLSNDTNYVIVHVIVDDC